jgi:hypothetical protein
MVIISDIASCSPHVYRRFGRTYHLHIQSLLLTHLLHADFLLG